jgi:aminoglycoside phosphotransferase (APT) family kinase protein
VAADVEPVLGVLIASSSPHVPVHRDFHDKQIVLDDDGRLGVLDLDTLSLGEPAIDVANLIVHFELRALQGLCTEAQVAAAAAELLEAYGPSAATRARLQAHADATRLRLAFLYAFRPAWSHVPALLMAQIGRTIGAEVSR